MTDFHTLPAETAAQLRELQQQAASVNGSTPLDDPRRQASTLLSAVLATLHAQGYSYKTLAKAAGVSPSAIVFRLSRHGYQPPPPSQAHNTYQGRMSPHIDDKLGRRRGLGDHCRQGNHLLDEANAYVDPRGYVQCRRCHADRSSRRYHRLRSLPTAVAA